ncbi:hypothetical protein X798_01786 [Onchocerca flexuosa]|uniref:Uncharacterized protein n=1 Tax=Onchocerca flexuosa TaxID=387005 RepID=A0A238C2U6_9BILA|nr:hypothetical protein X798_01786 [Onchocerca flexuosa]
MVITTDISDQSRDIRTLGLTRVYKIDYNKLDKIGTANNLGKYVQLLSKWNCCYASEKLSSDVSSKLQHDVEDVYQSDKQK